MKTFENNGKNTWKTELEEKLQVSTVFLFGQHMCRGNIFLTTCDKPAK